jgi:hypothetical protein
MAVRPASSRAPRAVVFRRSFFSGSASMSNVWQFKVGDKIHGPYSDSQLDQLIRSGRVDPDSLVRPSEDSNWRKAGRTPGLFGNSDLARSTSVADPDAIIDEVLFGNTSASTSDEGFSGPTKPCPFCAETIQTAAVKCKHCGEFLDGRPRKSRSNSPRSASPIARTIPAPSSVGNSGVAAVLSFFVCGLGQLYKRQVGLGFLLMFIDAVLWSLLFAASPGWLFGLLFLRILAIIDAAKVRQ